MERAIKVDNSKQFRLETAITLRSLRTDCRQVLTLLSIFL